MRPSYRPFKLVTLLATLVLVTAATAPALAQTTPTGFTAQALTPDETLAGTAKDNAPAETEQETGTTNGSGRDDLVSVVVKLRSDSLAAYKGDIAGLPATSPVVTGAPTLDVNSAASQLYLSHLEGELDALEMVAVDKLSGATITHRYDVVIGGMAMTLPASQVSALSALPNVEAVYFDRVMQLETDRSVSFIGAPVTYNKLGGAEFAGEGVIVGVLDSGVWPEHASFSDPDPKGKPYAAPPASDNPGGGFACEFGSAISGDAAFSCNNKLIGAYRFMDTYETFGPALLPGEFLSSRDDDGHGTHTATTAAGNAGVEASIFGVSRGTVSGVAPRAHVIAYKVCGDAGCYSSDSAAAIQQAILDGVDVVNFSISGGNSPYSDIASLAFYDAYNAGILVSASAGNSGPGADTVSHREPWTITVGASTADRAFTNTIMLYGNGGASLSVSGTSITGALTTPAPVTVPADVFCAGPFAAGTFTGQVVVCQRGGPNGRVAKGLAISAAGAVGMILYNQAPNVTDQQTDRHYLPASQIQFADGQAVIAFVAANPGTTATISSAAKTAQQGDVMASFSSRGGPGQNLGISKPDITAPGVQILAGHTPLSVATDTGPQGDLFQAIAGTSMSSPHVAGAAALIKDLYPNFTPGQVKSALMTTASTSKLYKEDGVTPFTPFDAGTGRVNLRKAWDPGLTFSDTGANYLALADELWKANYPSLYVPTMPGLIKVSRTAKEVSGSNSFYRSSISYQAGQPKDFKVIVPKEFFVPGNGEYTFDITVDARDVPLDAVRHATIVLTEINGCVVRIPVTIVRKQPAIALTKSCDPASFPKGSATTCTITVTNNSFDAAPVTLSDTLPSQLKLVPGSVTGGGTANGNNVSFSGTLAPIEPADVTAAQGTTIGYLGLASFNVGPIAGVGDETITNFNTAPFVYAGKTYTRVGMVSNGYLVVGGGTAADVDFVNTDLPDPNRPNNLLAPFWSDLNPAFGGQMRAATLSAGSNSWLVYEWTAVRNYGSAQTNTFQTWIPYASNSGTFSGLPATQIWFTYGTTSNGDGGFLTIGAENEFGNRGQAVYYNGTGTKPTGVVIGFIAGTPGETRTITFQAEGVRVGRWTNYVELSSPNFFGTNIARFSGRVTR